MGRVSLRLVDDYVLGDPVVSLGPLHSQRLALVPGAQLRDTANDCNLLAELCFVIDFQSEGVLTVSWILISVKDHRAVNWVVECADIPHPLDLCDGDIRIMRLLVRNHAAIRIFNRRPFAGWLNRVSLSSFCWFGCPSKRLIHFSVSWSSLT